MSIYNSPTRTDKTANTGHCVARDCAAASTVSDALKIAGPQPASSQSLAVAPVHATGQACPPSGDPAKEEVDERAEGFILQNEAFSPGK